jgi:hypothetical protein
MSWQKYYDWLNVGIENGWISEPFCSTHDMGPWSDEEMKELDEGYDPCFPAIRLYGQERVLSGDSEVTHVDAGTFLNVIRGQGPENHPVL